MKCLYYSTVKHTFNMLLLYLEKNQTSEIDAGGIAAPPYTHLQHS